VTAELRLPPAPSAVLPAAGLMDAMSRCQAMWGVAQSVAQQLQGCAGAGAGGLYDPLPPAPALVRHCGGSDSSSCRRPRRPWRWRRPRRACPPCAASTRSPATAPSPAPFRLPLIIPTTNTDYNIRRAMRDLQFEQSKE
jgi:hypothetical protein